ncbi:glycosyltransferase [soil metagenome]
MSPEPQDPVAPLSAPGEVPAALPAVVPAVVVVMVTHDPGPWFEETLETLAAQTYPDLSLLVIDTGSAQDQTERIHAIVPAAHVHQLDHDPGYGAAANLVSELVEGAAFYAFCHDDIALEPDSIRSLVEEAFRSNAGIIGPKLVDWNEPRRLLQVGMGVDKTGVLAPITERLELDQEQHDAVRDVFVVPGACTLVRADLFEALGGYDEGIDYLGEDVDLCWRAHLVGARVLIGPAARVRHLEALGDRRPVDDRRRRFARHRLRTTLVAYGPLHRVRVLPQALLFTVVEALYALVSGHPDHARDVLGAWPWNLRRLRSIRRQRAALKAVRRVSDKEVRGFQVRGSARLSAALRGQLNHREDRVTTFARSSRDLAGAMRDGSRRLTGTFALILGLLLLIGSRSLLFDGIPAVGELSRFPASAGTLLETWWSGWRRGGLGGPGAQPTAFGILGVLSYLSFGAEGFLRSVLIVATLPVGAFGAWRLARPIGSARASVAAFAVYVALPVPYNALARGSWSGLLLYATSPWILLCIGRASGVAPFGPGRADAGDRSAALPRRRPLALMLGLGLLLGVVAAFVPFAIVIVAGVALAFALGSVLCFRAAGVLRMLAITFGACVVAIALQVPWSLDVLSSSSPWEAVVGVGFTGGGPLTLGRILRFESGPWGAPPLGWAFLLAGALPVVIGRSWRLEWAVRAWLVVLAGWGLLWAGQEGHLPMGLPAAEVVLAPVAAALSFAAALGLASFEIDLRAYRFGWRQLLSVAAALGVVLGALPLGSGLLDGRWQMPTRDYAASLDGLLRTDGRAPFRVLWVGDPEVLPVAGWGYDDSVAYGTTDRGAPTVLDRFAGEAPGSTPLIGRALHQAQDQRTSRLGHLLGPMGVRYIVVPLQPAPSSSADEAVPPPELLTDALAQQLDLERVPVSDGIIVYRNRAWTSSRSVIPERDGDRTDYTQAVADDLAAGRPALTHDVGPVDARGEVPVTGDLLAASTADAGWKLRIDGVPMARSEAYGWANQFAATRTGTGRLHYDTPLTRRAAAVGQAVLWVLVIVVRRRARNAERLPRALLGAGEESS